MPEERSRTTKRKRITVPGGATVDVPVITQISFVDPFDRYQETIFTIDNSAKASREVRVDTVLDPGGPNSLDVERIKTWKVSDPFDRHQETQLIMDNETLGANPPPYFITHLKTHVVKYFGADRNNWIESELIDEFAVRDPFNRNQETRFVLNNPPDDDAAQADPADPEISDTANGIDPPWRTDPFQNIVRISSPGAVISWAYLPESILPGPAVGGGYHFRLVQGPAASGASITLSDGRTGIVTGTFPTVADVIFNPGAGVNYLAFPWWIIGPNTDPDTDPSAHGGYHYYDVPGPTGSFSQTWPFSGYTYQFGLAPAVFAPAGSLSVSFGPVALTVEGVPWTLTNIHVAFAAILESDFGATPTNMGFQPFFSATFEPP